MENTTATSSAVFDPITDEQVSHRPCLAITDDEMDGEPEEQLTTTWRGHIMSGKLISADTTAINKVLWHNKLIFTPEGQPATYERLSAMAFINGYLTIMSLQKDVLRVHMAAHL